MDLMCIPMEFDEIEYFLYSEVFLTMRIDDYRKTFYHFVNGVVAKNTKLLIRLEFQGPLKF